MVADSKGMANYLANDNPITSVQFASTCRKRLQNDGVLVLPGFLIPSAIHSIKQDGIDNISKAYYTSSTHNVYLAAHDDGFADDHPRNKPVASSKGCITTDQIPAASLLHELYNDERFRSFLCHVLEESALFPYADPLSSINLHYASEGQELGWHFDNSSFAITLLVQKPEAGGVFEYIKDARNSIKGEMNYKLVKDVLNNSVTPAQLSINEGDLVLFRGKDALHRVTPTVGDTTRMLVVLAYNTKPDVSLSESARKTFYGRLK